MKGSCKSCGHILNLEHRECYCCKSELENGNIWLAAAIVLVVIGVLLAWFGIEDLVKAVEQLNG
ncbi:Uncharacterised protein [Plesiomonas shigelloides]|uniref:hypothetical protein n=1 Tax=Plesiomonas shigelloides TaxID=703 RepID=UPI000DFCB65B|nr:hypothetical protein [Plesiomonas shigelloides]SUB63204.1 Uncharacterised protein [Plesiomonas shigelloides]SUB64032.1 Uncharacterised protein [Plesiomonas shigelloides]